MATSDKYDRQLRMWGANGQKALMEASVLLVNADAAGAETLKNLVLPGIGSFTIVDDTIVRPSDIGSNFFVWQTSLGLARATEVSALLCEMNEDVRGFARVQNIQSVLAAEPSFLSTFHLIVASNVDDEVLCQLSNYCSNVGIPLVSLTSIGFLGSLRLQYNYHCVLEAHGDGDIHDLRIADGFPELREYASTFNFESLDSLEHAHIPFVIILVHALDTWRAQRTSSNHTVPKTAAEKEHFRTIIRGLQHSDQEVNFQEALHNAYRVFSEKGPIDMSDLFDLLKTYGSTDWTPARCGAADSMLRDFDVLMLALVRYLGLHQHPLGVFTCAAPLPLGGTLPDMTSTTQFYVGLQQAYAARASADRERLRGLAREILAAAGRDEASFDWTLLDTFVKNLSGVKCVSTSPLFVEIASSSPTTTNGSTTNDVVSQHFGENIRSAVSDACDDPYDDPNQTPILWYLSIRAFKAFQRKYKRWPVLPQRGDATEGDVALVWQELIAFAEALGISHVVDMESTLESALAPTAVEGAEMNVEDATESGVGVDGGGAGNAVQVTKKHIVELMRYGEGHELHPISALVGGMAAQEVVKLLTHQYVPVNSTYVYNGIAACGAVIKL